MGVLLGRTGECEQILQLLEGSRNGHGVVRVLRGPPGVGKTALLSWTVEAADGFRVLTFRCDEDSKHLTLSALRGLVKPLLPEIDSLLPEHGRTLRATLGRGQALGDSRGQGAALVALLAQLTTDSPLLVVIDDLQWIDETSLEAILFAFRRLEHDPVLLLGAIRDVDSAFPDAATTFAIVGLSPHDVAKLLDGAVAGNVSEALALATGGNPLAIREIVDHLSADERAGRVPLPRLAPIGQFLQEAYASRTEALSRDQSMVLLCAAADPRATRSELNVASELGGCEEIEFESGAFDGLLEFSDAERVQFTHPLMRSAVYLSASEEGRRQAHKALAAALPRSEVDRRAWHLAASATAPDEATAVELESAAAFAMSHGDARAAGEAFAHAAFFSLKSSRASRLVNAGMAFSQAGATLRALEVFDHALDATSEPLARADIELLRAVPFLFAYGPARLQAVLAELADRLDLLDPERAASAEAFAALVSFNCSRLDDAQRLCRRAAGRPLVPGHPVHEMVPMLLAIAEALGGAATRCRRELVEYARRFGQPPLQLDPASLAFLAATLAWISEWSESSRLISTLIDHAGRSGEISNLPYFLVVRCDLNFRSGKWAAALADGARGVELAREMGQLTVTCYGLSILARVEAALGRQEEAARSCSESLGIASDFGCLLECVHSTIGFAELAAGRIPSAIRALEVARDISEQENLRLLTAFPWVPDLVEASLRAGSVEEAKRIVRNLKEVPGQGALPLALLARCQGLVASERFEERFEEALAHHEDASAPFETGRTQLSYGERLRREGRRKDAIEQLERAIDVFERLDASPWLDRANRELAACGRIRTADSALYSDLTIQEVQVALTVAGGTTNREAAAVLFLSPRTVEYHLQNVYRKLGIRSRAELTRRIAVDR